MTNNKRTSILWITFLLFMFTNLRQVHALHAEDSTDFRNSKRVFLHTGLALSRTTVRDRATSPLFYNGTVGSFTLGGLRVFANRETSFLYRAEVGGLKETYKAQAKYIAMAWRYSYLRSIPQFSSARGSLRAGGLIDLSGMLRINEALGNTAAGVDLFPAVFASAKYTLKLDRLSPRVRKFIFFNIKQKPRYQDLSFQLSLPVMNGSYRPGFSYLGSGISEKQPIFGNHGFTFYNGFRIMTDVSFTRYRPNGNAIRYSYLWNANTNKGKYDTIDIAQHLFQIAFLFKVN